MLAVLFLPRQFQVLVVENVNETHLDKAIWLFPAYLLLINLFVLPIALGGLLHFSETPHMAADYYVLTLPLTQGYHTLALLVFIGGLSAATGMVVVETIALSTMICNDLVMPMLLHWPSNFFLRQKDLTFLLLAIRRASIILILLFGYGYYRFVAEFQALVSIGLIAFTAVAQFAPAILGGIFWKQGSRQGVLAGLAAGITIWAYTLVVPTIIQAGLLPRELLTQGPWGISLLRPDRFLGLNLGLYPGDMIAQAVFWSLTLNCALYVAVSLFSRPSAMEHTQASLFVDIFKYGVTRHKSPLWRGTASIPDLKSILVRFLGAEQTNAALRTYAQDHRINWRHDLRADPGLVTYTEKLLAGTIGAASAHVMVASVVKEEPLGLAEVMDILDETRQVIAYSHELEQTSRELKTANERLQELDRLKDDFIATVTHELKTPLTSVRALAEILHDTPSIETAQRKEFARIIVSESKRLSRLINRVLTLQKLETGRLTLDLAPVDIGELIEEATTTHGQLIREKTIQLTIDQPSKPVVVGADRDRLMQVILNLVSNAVKFCPASGGRIRIRVIPSDKELRVEITDNGQGIPPQDHEAIFDKFHQLRPAGQGRPRGTGLGLAIARQIIEAHGGRIAVDSQPAKGATFFFTLAMGGNDQFQVNSEGREKNQDPAHD
jgi:signal transduction histidine kinase